MKNRPNAFTLIELLVVISIIALLIGILLPALGAARQTARKAQNTINLRTMHQGEVIHAQSNKSFYTGLNSKGEVKHRNDMISTYSGFSLQPAPGHHGWYIVPRFLELVTGDVVAPDHIISPAENGPTKQVWDVTGTDPNLRHANISYAALDIRGNAISVGNPPTSDAGKSWQDNMVSNTPIFSDRNVSVPTTTSFSLWNVEKWEGGVVWNDNHAEFVNDQVVEDTQFSDSTVEFDDLFDVGANAAATSVTGASLSAGPHGQHARMIKRNGDQTVGPEN